MAVMAEAASVIELPRMAECAEANADDSQGNCDGAPDGIDGSESQVRKNLRIYPEVFLGPDEVLRTFNVSILFAFIRELYGARYTLIRYRVREPVVQTIKYVQNHSAENCYGDEGSL